MFWTGKKVKRTILRECLRIARDKHKAHPEYSRFCHFSFIIQKNKLVEWGINHRGIPNILGYPHDANIHAEIDAYKKAKGLLDPKEPFTIINVRLNRQDYLRNSAPCQCCYNFLQAVGCAKIIFSIPTGFAQTSCI